MLSLVIFLTMLVFPGKQNINELNLAQQTKSESIVKFFLAEPAIDTCGLTDANGVSKLVITATSPVGSINLYSVQYDTRRKLAITTAALHNGLNQLKTFSRDEVFRPLDCAPVRSHEMNCSNTYKFSPTQKVRSGYAAFDRGHLVPANPNRFSTDALDNTFYCINMAPQDPYVNREPWQFVERLALEFFRKFPGFVITGLCDAESIDGPTKEGYANPACYWKLICYKENGTGDTRVVGFIGNNSLVNMNDLDSQSKRWADVTQPKSQSDIELVTRPNYIAKAWRDAATDLVSGRNEGNAPDPESCIAAKTITPENAIRWNNPKIVFGKF